MTIYAVTVYSKPNCMQCTQTKNLLDRRGIAYDVADILDEGNLAAAKSLGHTSAPVVLATTDEGTIDWSGFRPDLIEDLAKAAA